MFKFSTSLAVTLATTLALAAPAAQALELQGGGTVKLRPTEVQLGIQSPDEFDCPGAAKVTAWVFTNKPGTLSILLVRNSGGVLGPYPVTTVKGANGLVMGTVQTGFMIDGPTDTAFRVVVPGSEVASAWVPMRACR